MFSGKPRAGDGSSLDSLPEEPEELGKCSCVNHPCTATRDDGQVNIYTTWGSRQNSKLWADIGQGVVTGRRGITGDQRAKGTQRQRISVGSEQKGNNTRFGRSQQLRHQRERQVSHGGFRNTVTAFLVSRSILGGCP